MDYVLDTDSVRSRIESFNARHGKSAASGSRFYFEDGAWCERDPMGALVEPSQDPHERAKAIERYHRIVKDRAVKEFDALKQQLASMASAHQQMAGSGGFVPPPPDEYQLQELLKLRRRAAIAKVRHDESVRAVEKHTPPHILAREKSNAANIQRNQEFIQKLNAIEI